MRGVASIACVLLTPAVVVAQTTTTTTALAIRLNSTSADTFTFTTDACASSSSTGVVTAQWTYNPVFAVGTPCTPLRLWATDGECGDNPGSADTRFDEVAQTIVTTTRSGTFQITLANLPGFSEGAVDAGSGVVCGTTGVTKTHRVCGSTTVSAVGCGLSTNQTLAASPLRLVYDTKPPGVPTITATSALDSSIRVSFTVDADTATVYGEARGPTDADFVTYRGSEAASSAGKLTITGLSNGNTYSVRVRGVDAAGNVSEPSDESAATPVPTFGFFGQLIRSESTEQGGCGVAGAAPVALLLVALGRLVSRRRRP